MKEITILSQYHDISPITIIYCNNIKDKFLLRQKCIDKKNRLMISNEL